MRRSHAALALLAAGVVVAAVRFDLYPVSRAQQQQNRIRWMATPTFEKQKVRERWIAFRARPLDEQLQIVRRVATLSRLQEHAAPDGGRRPIAALEQDLRRMPARLALNLGVGDVDDPAVLADLLRARTRSRVDAFLTNLQQAGRLDEAERETLDGLSWDVYLQRALELQKREEIYLYAEGGRQVERDDDAEPVEDLEPLDVLDLMREARRLRGFLGRAGEVLGLTEAEQQRLEDASDEDFFRVARALMVPKAREYMRVELEMTDEQIARVLARPYRDLERALHRLVELEEGR